MLPRTGLASHSFSTHTAPEITDLAQRDGSVLVVPVGSVEQHGEHLPAGTDTILVTEVLAAALERLDDVPVLSTPPVWCGYSPHHLSLGGTLSGEFTTLKAQLEEIASTGLENGFDTMVFLNGHGGNTALIETAVSEVGQTHPLVEVHGLTYFEVATDLVSEIRESDLGGMAHGGEFETSLMLALYPDLVGDERVGEYLDEPYDLGNRDLVKGGPLAVYREFSEYSASGAIGDPSLATLEKGNTLLDGIATELASFFTSISERNRSN
ncbi:creatininase family protein [Saliphagus sp. GCM10025317]